MLEIRNLSGGHGGQEILHRVSLTCKAGEVTTLLGPNGCGKSTLLGEIVGLHAPASGEILAGGTSVLSMAPGLRARKIAYLPQGKNVPDITAGRMVLHGRFPYLSYPRRYRPADYEAARAAMARLGIGELEDRPLKTLSGGMRQKVYLAMALCQEAEVILLDEPTTYLDIPCQLMLADLLRELAREGRTVLTVIHDLLLALKFSHSLAVMEKGRVLFQGDAPGLLESGLLPRVFGVGAARVPGSEGDYYYTQPEAGK